MYKLSGFIGIPKLINNKPGETSAIGELSQNSRTYTKELGTYRNQDYQEVTLLSFNSVEEDKSGNTVQVEVPAEVIKTSLQLSQWLYGISKDLVITDDYDQLKININQMWKDLLEIDQIGPIVTNLREYFPSYIFFKIKGMAEDNYIRLWYSNSYFESQYDLYEIIVVPPLLPIDDFFKDREELLPMIQAINIIDIHERAEVLRAEFPYTYLKTKEYDWVDPQNDKIFAPVPWTVLIYGEAGNNDDNIRDAIVDWILDNSNHGREDWEKIFPDLFTPTEFYIVPFWDRWSIPNKEQLAGFHSPIIRHKDVLKYLTKYAFNYQKQHIIDNACVASNMYHSIGFAAIGNVKNRHAPIRFDEAWPDYALISSDSPDYARMSWDTTEFITLLTRLLKGAEELSDVTIVPPNTTRVKRGNYTYITGTYKKVQYLIPVRANEYPKGK